MSVARLQGTNALVTGGSSETGPFICRAFADAGANVATTWFSNEDGGRDVAAYVRERGGESLLYRLNLLDQGSVDESIGHIRRTWDQPRGRRSFSGAGNGANRAASMRTKRTCTCLTLH